MKLANAFVGQHFAFASGRTATLKQHLLAQSDVDRLLGSHSTAEFERVLGEIKLTAGMGSSQAGPEAVLTATEQWMKREVDSMSPDAQRPVFGVLWLAGDAPRLAYMLKQQHGLSSEVSREPATSLSLWDPDMLRAAVEGNTSVALPDTVMDFIASVRGMARPSPRMIDRAVAQFIAERKLALARASGSADILRFVRHGIDITNIRTALRLDAPSDRAAFLQGGSLQPQKLIGGPSAVRKAVASSDLYAAFIPPRGQATPTDVELIGAKLLAEDIGRMWTVPLTVEPVFAFAAMVMAHVRLIRAVSIGKRNGLSPQEIKQILPPFIPSSHFPV